MPTERTILCFGDSNTHGTVAMSKLYEQNRFARAQRWPSVMAAELGDGYEIIAEGLPGRTTVFPDPVEGAYKSGLEALPGLLETHRPIDLVIIMLGTNDTKKRFGVPAFDIALGLERLTTLVRQSATGPDQGPPAVLLASPVPVSEVGVLAPMFEGAAEKSRALGAMVEAAAERQQTGFVDLAKVAEVDPVDGVHLTAEAQEAIGLAMAKAVGRIFG